MFVPTQIWAQNSSKKIQKHSLQPKNYPPTPKKMPRSLVVSVLPVPAGPAGAPPKNMPKACGKAGSNCLEFRQGIFHQNGKFTHFSPASEWGVHSNFSRVQSSQE
jgi:hypothetical protein